MSEIIGVRFKSVGKIYYFSPKGTQIDVGQKVIVETSRGVECGEVVLSNREIDDAELTAPLKLRKLKKIKKVKQMLLKSVKRKLQNTDLV